MLLNKIKTAGRTFFAAGFILSASAAFAQVPANDGCATAQVIIIPSSGSACVTGTTVGATSDLTTNSCDTGTPGNEVWYTFTATGSQNTVTVTPTGSPAAQQVVVTILSTGCASNTYNNCNSSATNNGSASVNWTYTPGTQVWVSVETNGADGGFQLCVTSITPPATTGSSCATATTLCNMNSFSVGTFPANNNGFSPSCFFPPGTALQQPIFYQFTVGQTGTMQWQADPQGAAEYDWAVYNITSGCPGTQVACNYNYQNANGSPIGMNPGPGSCSGEFCDPVTVTAGQTYIIIIDNYSNNNVGFNFDWTGSTFTIAPTAQFTATPTTGCGTVTSCFTNTSVAATSYSWNFGNSNTSTSANPPCQTYSTPGTYLVSLTATSATGCTNTTSVPVVVTANPVANAGPDKVICSGASTTIGTAPVAGYTYSWSPSTGLSSSTAAQPTVTLTNTTTSPVTYTYTVTVTSGSCTATDAVVVTVNPMPVSNAGADITLCSGVSGSIGAASTAGYTYSWSPSTGLSSSTAANPTVTLTNTTTAPVTYTYTVTTAIGTCTTTDQVIVTVNPIPPSNAGPDRVICSGASTTIGTAPVAGYTYSWSPSTGLSSSTAANPTVTLTNTTTSPVTYTYTVTTSIGTCSTTDVVLVTVNPIPPSNAGADITLCSGATGNIGAASTAGYTYSWSPSTGLSSSTVANPTVTITNTTTAPVTYTYTVTTSVGTCSTTDQVIVTVNPIPPSNAGADITICSGATGNIGTTPVATYTYSWSPTTGLSSGTVANPTVTLTNTTTAPVTYTYTVTTSVGTCTTTDAVVVTVNPVPPSNAGADISFCSGGSGSIGTASIAGYTYSWSPSTGLSSATVSNPTVTLTNTTAAPVTYTYTVTTSVGTCTTTDQVIVTVNPIPVSNAGADITICSGATGNLGAASTAGYTYSWSPSTGLSSSTASNPTVTLTNTTAAPVTYTYTVTTSANTCTSTDAVVVTVNPIPVANAGPDVSLCNGGTTNLNATGGGTYSWSPAAGLSNSTIANPVASPTVTTTYTVTVTVGGCSSTDAVLISVGSLAANAGPDVAICQGSNTTLNATGGTTYSWLPATGLSSTSIANPVASPTVTTTYTVTVSNSTCSGTDAITVTVNPIPVSNAGADIAICSGATGNIGTASTAGYTYSWSPATGLSSTTASNPTVTITNTTSAPVTYTFTVTTTSNSCTSTDAVVVTVNPIPVSNAGADIAICSGATGNIGTASTAGYTYSWSPSTGLSSSTASNPTVTLTNTTASPVTYTYTVTTSGNSCTSTDAVVVTVNPVPASNAGADIAFCSGATGNIGTASTAGYTYSWSPSTGLSSSTASNPTVTLTNTTASPVTYTYIVTTSGNSCTSTDTVVVTVNPIPAANAGPDVSVCTGGSTILNATGGTGYAWTPATGLSNTSIANPVASPSVTTTYTVTVTANNCSSTDAVTVTIGSLSASAGPDVAICQGSSTQLNATGGTNYSWSPAAGLSSATIANPVASPTVTTTYIVTVSNSICSNTDTIVVTVNPIPVSNAGADIAICSGATGNLGTASTAGYTYSWSPAGGLSSTTASNPTVTLNNTTSAPVTTTFTVTTTANSCTSTDTVIVTVNPIPAPNASADIAICSGATGNIGAASTAGYTYSWSPSTGLSSSTASNPTVTLTNTTASPTTTTYIVTTTANSCSSMDTVAVTVNPIPVSNAGADIAICSGATGNIGTASTAGYTYSWSPATGLSNSTASNPTVTLTNTTASPANTTYIVTTTANSCTSTDTVVVTVNPIPAANAGPDATICPSTSTQIGTASAAGYTYSWSPATGLSSVTASNPTATPPSTISYTLTVTANNCTSMDTMTVTIANNLVVNTTPDDTICSGASTVISCTPSGASYAWSPATGLSSTTAQSPAASPTVTTTYTVTVTDAGGCTGTDSITVTVDPVLTLATAGFSASCYNSCDGQAVVIPGGGTQPYSYTWSSGCSTPSCNNLCAGTYSITVTDVIGCSASDTIIIAQPTQLTVQTSSTTAHCNQPDGSASCVAAGGTPSYSYLWSPGGQTTATATNLIPGQYCVTVTDFNGCTATACVTVANAAGVVASITSSTNTTCNGSCDGSATVNAVGGNTPYTYLWAPSGGTGTTASNLCAGIYNVTVTDTNGCSDTAAVTITEPTVVTVTPSQNTTICISQCTTLSALAQGGTPTYTYNWSSGNTNVCPVTTQVYTVTATDANGCVSAPATVTITVNPPLNVTASGGATICPGGSATLTGTPAGGNGSYSYTWLPAPGGNTNSITVSPASTTTYTVILTDGCGTPADSDVVTVTVSPLPVIAFSADTISGCFPVCSNFADNCTISSGTITGWQWDFGDGNTSSVQNPSNCYTTAGSYNVTLTATSSNGCTQTATLNNMINAYGYPEAEFAFGPQPATITDPTICFTDQSTGAVSWYWNFADVTDSTSTQQNPCHIYSDTATYCVDLTVVNANGCPSTVEHCLVISPDFSFWIPNAFTPNDDGINDYFSGVGMFIQKYEMYIFDRWGNMIFYTDDINKQWDGKANYGKEIAQEDVYVYRVNLVDIFDKKHTYIGHVTLIK